MHNEVLEVAELMDMMMIEVSMLMEYQGWKCALSLMEARLVEACLIEAYLMKAYLIVAYLMEASCLVEHQARMPWN